MKDRSCWRVVYIATPIAWMSDFKIIDSLQHSVMRRGEAFWIHNIVLDYLITLMQHSWQYLYDLTVCICLNIATVLTFCKCSLQYFTILTVGNWLDSLQLSWNYKLVCWLNFFWLACLVEILIALSQICKKPLN